MIIFHNSDKKESERKPNIERKSGNKEEKELTLDDKKRKRQNQAKFYHSQKEKFWDSKEEFKVYKMIRDIIGNRVLVFPHVSLRELFVPKDNTYRNRSHLSSYHIDFVIFSNISLRPLVAIELDGKEHNEESQILNDTFKDEMIKKYGIDLIRIKSGKYTKETLEELIVKAIRKAPIYCSECGALMKKIKGVEGRKDFYGCSNYKDNNCKNTENIDFNIL
nr:DUF2726 domain-containing protein [Clostridium gasigenes]